MPPSPNHRKPKRRRSGRLETIALFGGSALLVGLGFWVALQFVQPAPPKHIRIAAGQSDGAYFRYAQAYARKLAEHGIELEVLETDGTLDNLELLLRPDEEAGDDPEAAARVDLAMVQGGVADDAQRAALSGLGSMFYEPLWLLGQARTPTRTLDRLAGTRIGVGVEGSGTRALATRLLALNGLGPGHADLISQPTDAAAAELIAGGLDLLFVVAAPDSGQLQKLLHAPGVRLLPLPRAEAYARIDRALTMVELPQGVLDLAGNIPARDLPLVAATTNLVARPDIHPALVDLLLEAAAAVHGNGSLLAPPGSFPTPTHTDFPLNTDAARHYKNGPPFLQRYLPFWAATWIDRTKVMLLPLLALLFPLFKILPPVYAWRVRRRILRWYVQLRRIDLEIETGDLSAAEVAALRRRLGDIESDAAQIDVPLGYTDQLYNLRLHIKLLEEKLESVGGRGAATS